MSIQIDSYLVTEPGMTSLRHLQWLSERELDKAEDRFGPAAFDVRPAADVLGGWLTEVVAGREPPDALTRLDVLDDLVGASDSDPESETPDEVEFDAAAMAELRQQAVARYQRWGRLRDLGAPAIVLRNEGRMLQATARVVLAAAIDESQAWTVTGGDRSIFSPETSPRRLPMTIASLASPTTSQRPRPTWSNGPIPCRRGRTSNVRNA